MAIAIDFEDEFVPSEHGRSADGRTLTARLRRNRLSIRRYGSMIVPRPTIEFRLEGKCARSVARTRRTS